MVNWNGGGMAIDSVKSVMRQTLPIELWVVDNDSKDHSLESIIAACPNARIIRNTRNAGYAEANNQALKQLDPAIEYVLLINNDVILPDARGLNEVIRVMDKDPGIRGVCGRYEYPDGRFQHFYNQLPNPIVLMTQWGILRHIPGSLVSKRMRRFTLADADFYRPMTLEQPAFSCVLLRSRAIRKLSGFDERFPIFFNDIDFCWRWRQHGWTWHYLPQWRIIHHKSSSTSRLGGLLQAEMASSAIRFAVKHHSLCVSSLVRCAVVLEMLYRKTCHGEIPVAVGDIWSGNQIFCGGTH